MPATPTSTNLGLPLDVHGHVPVSLAVEKGFGILDTKVHEALVGGTAAELAAAVGAINATTGLSVTVTRKGPIAQLDFVFDEVALTFTDAAGSGSSASLKLFDFAAGDIVPVATRTAFTWLGDDLIDGDAGDLAFVYGLGSVAADAGDGALTSTEVDFAAVSGTVTLSSYTATSLVAKGAVAPVDGTTANADLYLNVSGTAATAEATGVLTVSGTARVIVALLGEGTDDAPA